MSDTLNLNCWVFGDIPQRVFPVKIEKAETIGSLKEAIKDKNKNAFGDLDAVSLVLWKVKIGLKKCKGLLKTFKVEGDIRDREELDPWDVVSEVLTDVSSKDLHVIVRRPPAVAVTQSGTLELNCLVLGEPRSRIFAVEIAETETVSALRAAIKEEQRPAFDHIPAATLIVWKVSLPADQEDLEQNLETLEDENALLPVKRLSPLFSGQLLDEHLHIVVKAPPTDSPSHSTAELEEIEDEDIVTAMRTRFDKTVEKVLKAKSPSESAKSSEYKVYQRDFPIYDGRYDVKKPADTIAPPIQLFHPVFGHFLDDLQKDLPVPDELAKATVGYMHAASGIYDTEENRKHATRPLLRGILGMGISTVVNTDKSSPDGLIEMSLTGDIHESIVALLQEDKRDFGDGGSDPSTQASLSMARYWAQEEHKVVRDNTCCPTFLFANAGPWFAILGAIFSDKVIVQRLTDYIWVGMDSSLNEPHCNRVAKIMHSLKRNVQKLRDYYAGFKLEVLGPQDVHPRYFPSVRAYRDEDGRVVEFKYVKPLELHPTCVTFLARFVDSPKRFVVKFVQRYGEDAHRILAKENLAPQLLYIGTIGVRDGDPSYGHLRMVVMEYIEGTTLDKARKLGQVPLSLGDQIKVALEHLHNNGFVFGDLRPPNVMITKNKELKLIDFDWAGEHMKTQYPLMMSPLLTWPTGVEGLSVMEKRHDDYMLSQLFPTS